MARRLNDGEPRVPMRQGVVMAQHSKAQQAERSAWSGKLGFILAGAASAVGLGNLWRFPTLAAKYGGGTFIFTYFILACL